jgi:hypothetical protein
MTKNGHWRSTPFSQIQPSIFRIVVGIVGKSKKKSEHRRSKSYTGDCNYGRPVLGALPFLIFRSVTRSRSMMLEVSSAW